MRIKNQMCSHTVSLSNRTISCGQYPRECRVVFGSRTMDRPPMRQTPAVGVIIPVSTPKHVDFPAPGLKRKITPPK